MMLMLGLNETIDQLAMADSVHTCGYALRVDDCHKKDIRISGCRSKEEIDADNDMDGVG